MGGTAVTDVAPNAALAPGTTASWKLAPDVARQAQGLVVSGFGDLKAARALVLSATTKGGGWLAAVTDAAPVSAADGKQVPSIALALTSRGLEQIGLGCDLVSKLGRPFTEGMLQKERRRRLGDDTATVAWGVPDDGSPPVHALLLVYDQDHAAIGAHVERIAAALDAAHIRIVRDIELDLSTVAGGDIREHFGFVDGISQPIPYGPGTSDGNGRERAQDPLHGVPLGEILLGHADAHGHISTGPFLLSKPAAPDGATPAPVTADPDAKVEAMLDPATQTAVDLGLNGSFLVVRELLQDVDGFWTSLAAEADRLNAGPTKNSPVTADWLAERVVGRTRAGDMLRPGSTTVPQVGGWPDNDVLFYREDQFGLGCPMGSHIRRANPRDGLAPEAESADGLLASANAHRILRRGRKFGGGIGASDKAGDKGLLFMCLNGDIARQFEFVQQNWLLNPNFATIYKEVDPLVGPKGPMTIPDRPLRRRAEVETFVKFVGGDYFFLPSLPALAILAAYPS